MDDGRNTISTTKIIGRNSNFHGTEHNLADAMADISPIQTQQTNTNNVSVVSTTGGLNFRQLKPTDSVHNSLTELPSVMVTSQNSANKEVTSTTNAAAGPFDDSPVGKNSQ